jgi:hypothetical protein
MGFLRRRLSLILSCIDCIFKVSADSGAAQGTIRQTAMKTTSKLPTIIITIIPAEIGFE